MNYFRCTVGGSGKGNTVTVTCAEEFAGLTITLSKTGKTYTKTCPSTAPYVVTFYGVENGTYTVSCTVDGETYSETVIVQDISCVLNYGFKWQTWVDTASQLDSSDYDSLDEVLADEKALRELFLEHACVDYMASFGTSNEDLETVINNNLCAKWINLSDYALDFLHANEVIADLMDEADKYGYGEWALMPQVPTMTSATAPFGEVLSSGYTSSYYAYYAFDGVTTPTSGGTNRWIDSRSTGAYIGFHFTEDVKVRRAYIKCGIGGETTTWKIQYSSTGNSDDWHDASDVITFTDSTEQYVDVSIGNAAYWRLYGLTTTANSFGVYELQFYAWAPKGNVPVMTADNAPYGTVTCDSYSSGYEGYRGFNNDISNSWISTKDTVSSSSPAYLGYTFTTPVKIKRASLSPLIGSGRSGGSNPVTRAKDYKIQASNDGSTWVDLYSGTFRDSTTKFTDEISINNDDYYLRYRILITSQYSLGGYPVGMNELQFYGRELKVSVPKMTSNTAPYGVASASSIYSSPQYEPFRAFDNDRTNNGWFPSSNNDQWINYQFTSALVPKMMTAVTRGGSFSNVILQGSNNGGEFTQLTTGQTVNSTPLILSLQNTNSYDTLRVSCDVAQDSGNYGMELQFYGLDYSEKEFEVGTTKKWLYDHGVELETFSKYKGSTTTSDLATTDESELYFVTLAGTNSSLSNFSIAGVTVDLSDYSLLRAKIGSRAVAAGNPANYLDMDIWKITGIPSSGTYSDSNIDAYVAPTLITDPNTISLSVSSYSEQKFVSVGTLYANGKKTSIDEFWLE